MTKKKTAILISGRGSNMTALIRAAEEADYPAEIVGVISDNADAAGLAAAKASGLEAIAIPRAEFPDKAAHEAAIEEALDGLGAEIICLAGFMRLLSGDFVKRWEGRMLNVHPSLLPLFKGLNSHKRALEAGMRIHGCTVHFVTQEMDGGPIIAQAAVPVLPHDTEEELNARVLKMEHQTYPMALALVASGKAAMENGRTVFARNANVGWGEYSTLLVPSSIEEVFDIEDLARLTP
ncbi:MULTISPECIES: phosphoribosylglycinamide formyltransferase [Nitratireductor]|jgi:phosphoribosylglycinamide formyltransferase-1/phosphoribosylamine--glycine ligase/phosphoribosylglycinamide formyltransferase/phosphoribosylformylglycinamidine cyclo-ligase|uniref:Phosphoribosylglycinamide formyltransferase n=1 Tax=Nitratireductor basaltis TaxID=472175 RepID=A0A084UC26_9HYPH|nr:phosphoribosylglycinamide formyltransferase [Nitratireductor basaltis]KFB10512.1 Formyltetrahydrofolate-dependent phosphoribosylglycinamide formyltransferase precursor [Nitratireductor basaltis]